MAATEGVIDALREWAAGAPVVLVVAIAVVAFIALLAALLVLAVAGGAALGDRLPRGRPRRSDRPD